MATVSVRYVVDDVDDAIAFYCRYLGFEERMHPAPTFATVTLGHLRLLLSAGARPSPTGPADTGRMERLLDQVDDLTAVIDTLREAGVRLRSDVVIGVGGKPVLPAVLSGADSVARVLHLGPHLPDGGVGCYPSFRGRRSGGVAARGENVQLDELIHPVPVRHVVSLYDIHDTTVAQ